MIIPIAKMISTVNKEIIEIIEMILNREMKFTDLNFEPETWDDAFIIGLLDWFDKKIEAFTLRKYDQRNKNLFNEWKSHFEQVVRILYYYVIYMNVKDTNQLYKVFKYLFTDDKFNNIYMFSDIISAEELITIYKYIIKDIPNLKKCKKDRKYIDKLIGIWNTEDMNNKFHHIAVATIEKNNIRYRIIEIYDESYKENSLNENIESNDEMMLKFLKEFFSKVTLNKINIE